MNPVTIHPDSLGQPLYGLSCAADFPLWFNWVNYEQPEESYQVLQLAEYNIYGSEGHGRFVTWKPDSIFADTVVDSYAQYGPDSVYYYREKTKIPRIIGQKEYELKDHLGNVRTVFTDQKIPRDVNNLSLGFIHSLKNVMNPYPFGMQQPNRTWNSGGIYRYGFIGQENDDETYGEGNSQDHVFRSYDPRTGRYKSIDPLSNIYHWNSPFAYAENKVIQGIDMEGLQFVPANHPKLSGEAVTKSEDGSYIIKLSESMSVSAARKIRVNGSEYYDVGQHLFYSSGSGWSSSGARSEQQTAETKVGLQLTSNIELLPEAPEGYWPPSSNSPNASYLAANKYIDPMGLCYANSMARVHKAYEDAWNVNAISLDHRSQDYNISGTGSINIDKIPDQFFGYGVGGALAYNGYAELIGPTQVWKGDLQIGAMIQYWMVPSIEDVNKNNDEMRGHSVIFHNYTYNENGDINGLVYSDYRGIHTLDRSKNYIIMGANLKDQKEEE